MAIDTTRQLIQQITNASSVGENTATRVGNAMEAMLNDVKAADDKAVAATNRINTTEQGIANANQRLTTEEGVNAAQSAQIAGLKQDLQNIRPVTIEGDVVNNPDNVFLTSANDEITPKERTTSLSAKGHYIMRPTDNFAAKLKANYIHEIPFDVNLAGAAVTVPDNCILHFSGGSLKNGTINLNGALLSGNVNILCDVVPGHPASNTEILVDWFGAKGDGATDDSKSMLNAINALPYVGGKLIFGKGKTYLHGDGVSGSEGTGNSYTPATGNPQRPDTSLDANIGRDITLRFVGYDSLVIDGNGSTILSNPQNGVCKHNEIFFFGACNNLTIKDLTINANNKARNTYYNVNFADYSTGNWGGYTGDVYDNWRNHVWVDNPTKGFALRGNMEFYSCISVNVTGVTSLESLMDCFLVSSLSGHTSRAITFRDCVAKYPNRLGIAVGLVNGMTVDKCEFGYAGKYNDLTAIGGATNNAGISTELEVEPITAFDYITGVSITNTKFYSNRSIGLRFSAGTRRCKAKQCYFADDGFSFGVVSLTLPWKLSEDNEITDSHFYNSIVGIAQSGSIFRRNTLEFDKDFANTYSVDSTPSYFTRPIYFEDNAIVTDLTGAASGFSNYVNLTGNSVIRRNYVKDIARGSGVGVTLSGVEVTDNVIERTATAASGTISVRPAPNIGMVSSGNKATGFTTIASYNREAFNITANRIIRALPNDTLADNVVRWYELPKTSGIITVVSLSNLVYTIHITYDGRNGAFRGVYYDGLRADYTLEAIVYYKGNTAYLRIAPTNYASITYEQIVRHNNTTLNSDFAFNTISEPDVSTFNQMYNLCLKTSQDYTTIDAYLAGVSMFKDGKPHWWTGSKWVDSDGHTANLARVGATSERPTGLGTTGKGFEYFDTNLSLPIWWNGSAWIKSDGTTA